MPSATSPNNGVIEASKPDAQNSVDHLSSAASEARQAASAAAASVANGTSAAVESAQGWFNTARDNGRVVGNETARLTQDTANLAMDYSRKTATGVRKFGGEQYENARRTSISLLNRAITPEQRDEYEQRIRQFAKKNPLAFSFLFFQFVALAIPLAIFGAIALTAFTVALSTTFVSTFAFLLGASVFWFPLLGVLSTAAAITWAVSISTFLGTNWVYFNMYKDSRLESDVKNVSATLGRINHDITANAEEEASGYATDVQQGVQRGQERIEDGANMAINRGTELYENGRQKAQDVKNGAYKAGQDAQKAFKTEVNEVKKNLDDVNGVELRKNGAVKVHR